MSRFTVVRCCYCQGDAIYQKLSGYRSASICYPCWQSMWKPEHGDEFWFYPGKGPDVEYDRVA